MRKFVLSLLTFLMISLAYEDSHGQVTFEAGKISVRADAFGAIRLWRTTATDTIRQFDRASILVSGNLNQVYEYYYDVDIEDSTVLVDPSLVADFEIFGVYNNDYSGAPPNVLYYQNIYGWVDKEFILVKMKVVNNETSDLNSSTGFDIIPRVNGTYENDSIYYNVENNITYMVDSVFVGFKMLGAVLNSSNSFDWFDDYSSNDTLLYEMMTNGEKDTEIFITNVEAGITILASEQMNLTPQDSSIVYFVIALGSSESELITNINDAEERYNELVSSVTFENYLIPNDYLLKQNYPNPFNPNTKISFSIPETENVNLVVYNLLGEVVAELVNSELAAGNYNFSFDGSNLTSGIYFYTITAGQYSETKKMMLMK